MLTDSLPFPKCKIMIRLQSLELKSITKMEFHVPASQSMGKLHQVCDWLNEFSKHVCILLESNNCPFTNNNFDCCTSLNFLTCLTTLCQISCYLRLWAYQRTTLWYCIPLVLCSSIWCMYIRLVY